MTYLSMLIFLSNAILGWNVQRTAWHSVAEKLTRGWMIQFERGSELAFHGVMRDGRLEDLDKFLPLSSFMGCSSVWSLHVNLTEKSCLPSKHSFWASSCRSQCVLKKPLSGPWLALQSVYLYVMPTFLLTLSSLGLSFINSINTSTHTLGCPLQTIVIYCVSI